MKLCWSYHQGLYTWTPALRTLFVYTELAKKKIFGQLRLAVAPPARRCHGRQKVLIPECDLTGRRSTITLLGRTPGSTLFVCRDGDEPEIQLQRWVGKFHVVSRLLTVLNIDILMLACQWPMHSIENLERDFHFKTRDTVQRWFTPAVKRTNTSGTRGHSRCGQVFTHYEVANSALSHI